MIRGETMHQKRFRFHVHTIRLIVSAASLMLLVAGAHGQQFEPYASEGFANFSSSVSSPTVSSYDSAPPCEHGCGGFPDCRAGGCRGQSHLTIRDMWQREYAAGDEPQHFSYDTRRLYYYRRPYNMYHVRQARSSNRTTFGFNGQQALARSHYQARAEIFASVNRELKDRYTQSHEEIEGGHLEYVDWKEHQDAKKMWKQDRLSETEPANDEARPRPNAIRQSMRQLRPPSLR